VDLQAQLASPGYRFKRLVERWRLLPPDLQPDARPATRRRPQRAEDRLGPDGVAQLVADYQCGRSTKWLQQTYGLSQGAVLRLLDRSGVPRRQRGLTDEQVKAAIRLYARDWSLTRIGDHFDKHHTVVKNALMRAGITIQPRT
jgi:hypothetical protein